MDSKRLVFMSVEDQQRVLKQCQQEYSESERKTLESYCIAMESIDEIYQWFRSFMINLALLVEDYKLLYNDQIISIRTGCSIDFYTINTFTSNIISSGKTLVDRIEVFFKEENSNKYEDYRQEYSSKVYDSNFFYRFLIKARDFVQHGHYIVSGDSDGRYGFDFKQLLAITHFNINGKLFKELEEIQRKFDDNIKGERSVKHAFTYTLDLYCVGLTEVYFGYYKLTKDYIRKLIRKVIKLLKMHPKTACKSSQNGLVRDALYCDFSDGLHKIEVDIDFYYKFKNYMREAKEEMNRFKKISCKK